MDGAVDWKGMALECLNALKLMHAHYFDDLIKGNPSFLGKVCLQDYGLMNEAFMAERAALDKYGSVQSDERLPIIGVVIEGGVLQEAISEIPVQIMVIDGDKEGGDPDEMALMVDLHGEEYTSLASIWNTHVDARWCMENAERIRGSVYCPECQQVLRGAENVTSIADHGRCFDCHKKWQNGELEED